MRHKQKRSRKKRRQRIYKAIRAMQFKHVLENDEYKRIEVQSFRAAKFQYDLGMRA